MSFDVDQQTGFGFNVSLSLDELIHGNARDKPMPPFFKQGDRVILDFGVGDPQLGEIIAASLHCDVMTVRLSDGVMGRGEMPLQWRSDNDYELLAGGKVKIRRLT